MQKEDVLANTEVLENMAKDTSREVMPTMIQVYCDELTNRRDLLNKAFKNSDAKEIGEQAHAIKSSSGTFGAQRLRECASNLEQVANKSENVTPEFYDLVDKVSCVLDETIAQYQKCILHFQ